MNMKQLFYDRVDGFDSFARYIVFAMYNINTNREIPRPKKPAPLWLTYTCSHEKNIHITSTGRYNRRCLRQAKDPR